MSGWTLYWHRLWIFIKWLQGCVEIKCWHNVLKIEKQYAIIKNTLIRREEMKMLGMDGFEKVENVISYVKMLIKGDEEWKVDSLGFM